MKRTLVAVAAATIALGGCGTLYPNKAGSGTTVGGLVGGVIGAVAAGGPHRLGIIAADIFFGSVLGNQVVDRK